MQAHGALLAALEAGTAAFGLGRMARAVELFERALAAADADATLPRDSLFVPIVLDDLISARVNNAKLGVLDGALLDDEAAYAAAWRSEPRALTLSQCALALLLARFDAGTLFAPLTPVERSVFCDATRFLSTYHPGALPSQRADSRFSVTVDAVTFWPPLSDPAAEGARVRGVAAAVRAMLTLHAHSVMHEGRRINGLLLSKGTAALVMALLDKVLDEVMASGGLLHKLRAINALTREEEATLRQDVLPAVTQMALSLSDAVAADRQARKARAAADLERHGLRACALPDCSATEPQPKAFKVCSRCRRACYCSAAHQQQDWRRHKREDACATAPPR